MPRVCRYFIFASFGILIGAAEPEREGRARNQQPAAHQTTQHVVPSALPPIVRTISTEKPDVGCDPNQPDRRSDLCAQWKAADAAYDAAKWSWWQLVVAFLGIGVGGGTLIAAINAARWAREAAQETRRSADLAQDALAHTRAVTDLQIRPYVDVSHPSLKRVGRNRYRFKHYIRNSGAIPSRDVGGGYCAKIVNFPISKDLPPVAFEESSVFHAITPNARKPAWSIYYMDISDDELLAMARYDKALVYWIYVEYRPLPHLPLERRELRVMAVGEDLARQRFRVWPKWAHGDFQGALQGELPV